MLAVGAYLSGVIPLFGITLLEFGVIQIGASVRERMHTHFLLLIGFLIVSHVAMVFGMADPAVTGWQPQTQQKMHMQSSAHAAAPHDSHTVNEL